MTKQRVLAPAECCARSAHEPREADITVSLAQLEGFVDDAGLAAAMATFPVDRVRRLRRFSNRTDLQRGAVAEALARTLLATGTGVPPREIPLRRTSFGAPELSAAVTKGTAVEHVSLAHSGDLVVCAISDRPVGVDLEVFRQVPSSALPGMFRNSIVHRLQSLADPARSQNAIRLWTAVEAYLKMLGVGLRIDPRSVCISATDGCLLQVGVRRAPAGTVRLVDIDDQYALAICRPGGGGPSDVALLRSTAADVIVSYLNDRPLVGTHFIPASGGLS